MGRVSVPNEPGVPLLQSSNAFVNPSDVTLSNRK